MKIVLVHGFLGLPQDWKNVVCEIKTWNKAYCVETVDLFGDERFSPQNTLEQWAQNFIEKFKEEKKICAVGYSLGGRLLAQAVLKSPELFDQLVFVSSNPFIIKDRELRLKSDRTWSDRFLTQDWELVVKEWNAQNVFTQSSSKFKRSKSDFNVNALAQSFLNWSPALHTLEVSDLAEIVGPRISWIYGERDLKYSKLHQQWALELQNHHFYKILEAGHRVPWDQEVDFKAQLKRIFDPEQGISD